MVRRIGAVQRKAFVLPIGLDKALLDAVELLRKSSQCVGLGGR
jgi:hypothetical protein